ncbi:MAG: thiamine pyrophosphokinase, partial [Pseudomonadota bacterium]|nr:thiamine pyrophosphokinase [Pseudomonadota bacterium]
MDHELAVHNALVRYPNRRCVLIGETDVLCVAPPKLTLDVAAGTRVSLFPMRAVTGRSEGLKWPIDGLDFAPDGMIGTSNAATGPVTLEMDGPGMLLILPKALLSELVKTLLATPEGWPVP